MRIRTDGSILTDSGTWVVRTTDQGPARGRVEGQRGYGGLPVSDAGYRPTTDGQRCPACGSSFGSTASLATHRSRKHRGRAA